MKRVTIPVTSILVFLRFDILVNGWKVNNEEKDYLKLSYKLNRIYVLLILSIFLFTSCNGFKSDMPQITFNDSACIKIIAEDSFDSLVVKTNSGSTFPFQDCTFRQIDIKNKGVYYLFFRITKPEIIGITIEDAFYACIIPGDTLIIRLGKKEDMQGRYVVDYRIDNPIYQYLKKEKKEFGYFLFERSYVNTFPTSLKQLEKEFMATDSIKNRRIEFLENNKAGLPEWFINTQRLDYIYHAATTKCDLNWYFHDMNLNGVFPPCDVKLNNEEAKLSGFYYDFLGQYFYMTYLDEKHNNLVGPTRAIDLYNKASKDIYSNLKGDLLHYYNFGTIVSFYNASFSQADIDSVDKFRRSRDFELTKLEEKYLDRERSERQKVIVAHTNYKLLSGDLAPIFVLKDTAGIDRKSSEFSGKLVCIHFWATWCQPCLKELPLVNDLCAKLKNKPVVVINICLDDKQDKWNQIIRKENLKGVNLICNGKYGELLQKAYSIRGIPHYTLIDREGRLIINECQRPPELYNVIIQSLLTHN
jgi:thiol-disulfide isomerase/thioredoxin